MSFQRPESTEDKLLFSRDYDKEREENTERILMILIKSLQGYYSEQSQINPRNAEWIMDPIAIAEIKGILDPMKFLFIKYRETSYVDKIKAYQASIRASTFLPTIQTIQKLEEFSEDFVSVLGLKHNFKDRVEETQPWDKEVKKKFHLPELEGKDLDFFNKIPRRWQQIVFLGTANMVLNDGDCYALATGNNNAGKSNTSICFLWQANRYLRNYWKVKTDMAGTTEIPKFNLRKNVIYLPETRHLDEVLGDTQYNCLDFNEGMNAAVNLRSMSKDVIDMGVTAYISRSKHNFIFFEYQVTKRPPALLMERFNMWVHKMSPKWGILSMPSGLYRKTNPLYLDELDKLRHDSQISRWFVKKNPNFICKFRAPRLKPRWEKIFRDEQAKAHEIMRKAKAVKMDLKEMHYADVKEIWDKVNVSNQMAWIDIGRYLKEELKYTDNQCKKFMKRYDDYDQMQKFMERKSARNEPE